MNGQSEFFVDIIKGVSAQFQNCPIGNTIRPLYIFKVLSIVKVANPPIQIVIRARLQSNGCVLPKEFVIFFLVLTFNHWYSHFIKFALNILESEVTLFEETYQKLEVFPNFQINFWGVTCIIACLVAYTVFVAKE